MLHHQRSCRGRRRRRSQSLEEGLDDLGAISEAISDMIAEAPGPCQRGPAWATGGAEPGQEDGLVSRPQVNSDSFQASTTCVCVCVFEARNQLLSPFAT